MAAASSGTPVAPTLNEAERKVAKYLTINEAYPGCKKVHEDPPIFVVENFLTPDECTALRDAGAPGLKRSIVVDGAAGKSAAPSRTSESCYLSKDAVPWLLEKVTALTGKTAPCQEPPQVARYQAGQFYLAHFDAFDMTTGPGRECAMTGGQRVGTVLIYLNDVPEGGATYFPKLEKRFFPVAGSAVVFFPATDDGKLDPLALHAAEKCGGAGDKWVSQIWLRQADFDKTIDRELALRIGAIMA